MLRRKAEQGVKVYVIVYKEVTQTMNMSSHHTKVCLFMLLVFDDGLMLRCDWEGNA